MTRRYRLAKPLGLQSTVEEEVKSQVTNKHNQKKFQEVGDNQESSDYCCSYAHIGN